MAWSQGYADGSAMPADVVLAYLRVKRLSAGSGISQVVWGQAEKLAADFLQGGESDKLRGQIPYGQMQKLFS